MMQFYSKNSERLLAVNCFRKKLHHGCWISLDILNIPLKWSPNLCQNILHSVLQNVFENMFNTFFMFLKHIFYVLDVLQSAIRKKCFYWPVAFFYRFCSCSYRTIVAKSTPGTATNSERLKPEENILKQYWHIFLWEKITSKCNKVYKVSFLFVF